MPRSCCRGPQAVGGQEVTIAPGPAFALLGSFQIGDFVGYHHSGQEQGGADEHQNCYDNKANQYERLVVFTGFFGR